MASDHPPLARSGTNRSTGPDASACTGKLRNGTTDVAVPEIRIDAELAVRSAPTLVPVKGPRASWSSICCALALPAAAVPFWARAAASPWDAAAWAMCVACDHSANCTIDNGMSNNAEVANASSTVPEPRSSRRNLRTKALPRNRSLGRRARAGSVRADCARVRCGGMSLPEVDAVGLCNDLANDDRDDRDRRNDQQRGDQYGLGGIAGFGFTSERLDPGLERGPQDRP